MNSDAGGVRGSDGNLEVSGFRVTQLEKGNLKMSIKVFVPYIYLNPQLKKKRSLKPLSNCVF